VQTPGYWNESLQGWASSYLGGTCSNDLRNSISALLIKRLAPEATSVLDVGCAGATLAEWLGPEIKHYCGVDISEVAIERAREVLAQSPRRELEWKAETSSVEEFKPDRSFDVIVFNEVLYYLPLAKLGAILQAYTRFLTPRGLIVISLKNHELCRCVQAVVEKELAHEKSVLFQERLSPGWKIVRDAQRPAFLVQAYRART
jgi:2-polyprenyl-3-methyl-5-hydroxy-6-metoxy-1,4-benzoquinol methylase